MTDRFSVEADGPHAVVRMPGFAYRLEYTNVREAASLAERAWAAHDASPTRVGTVDPVELRIALGRLQRARSTILPPPPSFGQQMAQRVRDMLR